MKHDSPAVRPQAGKPARDCWWFNRSPLEQEHCATIKLEARESDGKLIAATDCVFYTPSCIDLHIQDLKALKKFWLKKREERK